MTSGVSIVLCCYNSSRRLGDTLFHLARLNHGPELPIELVVIDNASIDNTASFAKMTWAELGEPFPLQVVIESRPGLTNARLRGLQSASHEILIFCDDDNWLEADYATIASEIIASDPRIALVGGRTEAVFESPDSVPAWFPAIAGSYAIGGDPGSCELPAGEIVWGAGMVCRKSAIARLMATGFTFIASDRTGSALSAGGDAELSNALRLLGYTLHHDGRLRLKHFVPVSRVSWKYAISLGLGFGAATIVADAERVFAHDGERFRNFIRQSFVYQTLRGGLELLPRLITFWRLPHTEGNLEALSVAPKFGRWRAIADLGSSYRETIRKKVQWMKSVSQPDEDRRTTS
jgi:hypothetical protein